MIINSQEKGKTISIQIDNVHFECTIYYVIYGIKGVVEG